MTSAKILARVKVAIRSKYVWPGAYPLYIVMSDGAPMSVGAAQQEWKQICYAHLNGVNKEWQVADVAINWDVEDLICDHTHEKIPSAVGGL
jgi:hypothetical protein